MFRKAIASLILAVPASLFAQVTLDGPYQVNYASHLDLADGVVNVTNSGASAGSNVPVVNFNSYGDICVNAYVYAPDQELAACCSCLVSPNSLHSWPVSFGTSNLLHNVNNTTVLASINATHSVVIKLLATAPNGIPALTDSCPRPDSPNGVVNGLVAWGTHSHPTNVPGAALTETQFVNSSLSTGELGKLTNDCRASLTTGSGSQCPGCLTGGLDLGTSL